MLVLYYAVMFFAMRDSNQQYSKLVFDLLKHEVINNPAPTNLDVENLLTKPIFKSISYQVILIQPSGQTYIYNNTRPNERKFTTVTFPIMSSISNSSYQITNRTLTGTIKLKNNYQLYTVLRHRPSVVHWISYRYWLPLMAAILLFIIALLYMFNRRTNWESLLRYTENLTQATKERYIASPFIEANTTPEFLRLGHALSRFSYQLHSSHRRIKNLSHRLERLVDQSPLPMVMIMRQGQISFFNQRFEQVFTTSFQPEMHYSLTDFLTGSDKTTQQLLQNLSTQRVSRTLLVCGLEDKQAYQLHVTPWFGEHGQIHGFTVLLNSVDSFVSQIDDLQQQNRKLERQIKEFAKLRSVIGHELRTPLNAIIGTLDLIETHSLSFRQNETLATLTQSSQSMLTMLNDMLDMAKIQSGKTEIVSESTDIFKLGQQVSDLMVGSARKQAISLIYFFAPDCPRYINTDNSRLRQILMNLLNNAIKFTPSGYVALSIEPMTREQISRNVVNSESDESKDTKLLAYRNRMLNKVDKASKVNAQHHWIRFSIRDTGIGIAKAEQHKLFFDFSQANDQINQNFGGTGLGLAISNSFAQLLGGFIQLDSDSGNGSTFALYLPCVAPTYQPAYHFHSNLTHMQLIAIVRHKISAEFLQRICSHLSLSVSVYTQLDRTAAEQIKTLLEKTPTSVLLLDYDYYDTNKTLLHYDTESTERLVIEDKIIANSNDLIDSLLSNTALPKMLLSMKPERGIPSAFLDQFDGFLNKPLDVVLLLSEFIRLTTPALNTQDKNQVIKKIEDKRSTNNEDSSEPSPTALILVVDDNLTNQKITCKLLDKLGYRSIVADSGQQAIEQLAAQRQEISLILMDCRMPIMNGLEATQIIRSKGDNIPIIALTANNTDEDRASCKSVGMNDFLAKPINRSKLQTVLAQFIAN